MNFDHCTARPECAHRCEHDARQESPLWADAVRAILAARIHQPGLSLLAVARMLAVSPRTLQRRLAEEGTTWRALVDATRRVLAEQLSRQGHASEATTARLGYSGSRALRRAVRRWTSEGA